MSPRRTRFLRLPSLLAGLLMAAGILVFVAAALASAFGLLRTRELSERRTHSYQSLWQVEAVMSELKDLETGQRGFLITGDETFLKPYLDARQDFDAKYRSMRSQMADASLEAGFWERLEGLVRSPVEIAERSIRLRRDGQFDGHADLKRLLEGKKVMDALRKEFDTLTLYRLKEIQELTTELERARQAAFGATFGAGIFGLGLMLASLVLFLKEQRHRLDAEAVLESANSRLEAEVQARTEDLQLALEQIQVFAGKLDRGIEEERRRLAREVHDQIGQIFTAMKLIVGPWAERFAGDTHLQQQLDELGRQLDQGFATARRITAELEPPLLEDFGLGDALEHYFSQYCGPCGVTCRVETQYDYLLNQVQATALFRIAQEAFTNVLRHSKANRIVVSDRLEQDIYHLVIQDDGKGVPGDMKPSFGLRGMEERARLVGGTFRLSSVTAAGVRIEVTLPVDREGKEGRDEHSRG